MAARTYDSRGIFVSVDGLGDFGAANGQVRINGVTSLTGPNFAASDHDVTDLTSSAFEREPGLPNYSDVSISAFDNPASIWQRVLNKMRSDQEVRTFQVDVTQRTLQEAATAATIRGIAIAAPVGGAAAVATFSGSGLGTTIDIRNIRRLSEGSTLLVSGTAYLIGQHLSATTASVTRLDGVAVTQVAASVYSVVRPRTLTEFQAFVSSMNQNFAVDARNTVEITLMVSGEPTITRSAS